eukprot:2680273-Amphidinium_carterae.2
MGEREMGVNGSSWSSACHEAAEVFARLPDLQGGDCINVCMLSFASVSTLRGGCNPRSHCRTRCVRMSVGQMDQVVEHTPFRA